MDRTTDTTCFHEGRGMSWTDDIAIVGYSFKLPQGIDNDASFWEVLQNRRNLMTDWPKSRMNAGSFLNNKHHNGGHFINDDVGAFDAPFFSLTAKEASSMDPTQRWTLEATYHAFEKAGITAESLRGSRTAVFSASMLEDYARMTAMDPDNAERTAVTGSTAACMIPNRISWYFDLRGPSIHVNTACSSSLTAVDMACKTLRSGDASCAVVTGSNLLLDPAIFQMLSSQNFLSPDSMCYSFDHRANGYARGEGVIALVLKPVSAAVQDGDMIRAIIRSTGSNQDGRTPVLTQPSLQAQEDLIRHVYKQANLSPDDTRYTEAHGTGTPVGDPIEMNAIGRFFRASRSRKEPLYVGSVKSNIGHLEGASGLASLVKSILVLEKGIIPPNALFEKINPAIDVDFYHIAVPTQNIVWPRMGLRRVSVNSFGFGGSNTHMILDDAFHYLQNQGLTGNHCTVSIPGAVMDGIPMTPHGTAYLNRTVRVHGDHSVNRCMAASQLTTSLPKLLVWTAADEQAVKRTMQRYETFYRDTVSDSPARLERLAYTLAVRRTRMLWRTFAIVTNASESQHESRLSPAKPIRSSTTKAGLAFVFTGQGAQYVGMGWDLVRYSLFAEMLRRIDDIYGDLGCKWSIFDELRCGENIDKPEYSQPLTTAVQIALVELFKTFGVIPKAVVGHSSGEIAAAYAIGALSLSSACRVSYFRGQLAGRLMAMNSSSPGAMLSINLAEDLIPGYLKRIKAVDPTGSVCVACINSPLNCTLSGPEAAIDAVKAQADKDGIFAQKLKTGVAYHSPSMQDIANEYLSMMSGLDGPNSQDLKAGALIPMISSVSGKAIRPGLLARAQYWVNNMISPVRFADAMELLTQSSSITDFVEIGPHSALRRAVQDTISQAGNWNKQIRYAAALQRSQPATQTTVELVGQLFCLGHPVSVATVNQQSAGEPFPFLVDCPEYPFDRSHRYWAESRLSRDFRLRGTVQGEMLGIRVSDWNPMEPRWRNFLSIESTPWIGHHIISGTVLYPAAGMLVMAIEAVQQMVPASRTVTGYLVKRADFISPIIVEEAWEDRIETQVRLRPVKKQQYEKEEESTWFETAIFSYSRGRWAACFRASIRIDYQEPSHIDEERLIADQGVRSRYLKATESCRWPIDSGLLYHEAAKNGLQYGDWFQLAQDVRWDGEKTAVARVNVSKARYQTSSLVHPAVLDQTFHVLRVSAGQQSAANVPVSLSDAWFASSGWQHPQTGSVRWLATSTSTEAGYGEYGALCALADDGTVLCTIQNAVMAAVSKSTKKEEKKLMYNIEWKPQLSLLSPEQLARACHVNSFTRDETGIATNHVKLCSLLEIVAVRTLRYMDRAKVPDGLRRHVEWMEHHVSKLSASQRHVGESFSDAEVEARLCEVETVLPAWKLYTSCARKLPEILAGEINPLQVVFESDLANIFYANLFQTLCDDGRLAAMLDLASHENPALRILEVGAGTGGMTGHVLAALQEREKRTGAPSFAEYTYTDISPVFFERASSRWPNLQAQGRITFKTLDLDRTIEAQGFKPASYDLVVAASVLHATPDLEATIRNVRRVLKPGGRLILLEVINPDDIATNFMAGLVPGWWVAREEWRPHSAAVPEQLWNKSLRANGFSGNDLVIRDHQSDECHIMSIIVTTALEESALTPCRLVLVVDQEPSGQQLRLANLVHSHLDPNGNRPASICDFSLDQLSKELASLTKYDIVICVAEVNNRPLLSSLCEESFTCLQYLILRAPNLLWATATSINDEQYPDYSVVQGFLRSVRAEQPESRIVTVAIEGEADAMTCACSIVKAFRDAFDSPSSKELEYIIRDGLIMTGRVVEDVGGNGTLQSLLSHRLQHKAWAEGPALQLSVAIRGSLDSLQFVRDSKHETNIAPYEIEIEAKAWGLSHRDVQTALGRQHVHHMLLGGDCAGVVTRVGRHCDPSIRPGDRVCMMVLGCMRKYPRAHETSVFKIPETLPIEAVTSILVPGMTAYHALVDIARLQEGDKILIHSAAGSEGQMAVRIAEMQGAEIFVTASSREDKKFLVDTLGIAEDRVFYNRPTSLARGVMRVTQGYGVDVVFNLLSGNEMCRASLECLTPGGRFVQIGHRSLEVDETVVFARNATFSTVDLMGLGPKITGRLMKKTVQLLGEGKIQHPQPLHIFNVSNVPQAFRQAQDDKTIGRIVITAQPEDVVPQFVQQRPSWTFDEKASYLIAGGSGGLGRAIIEWMADRGAKNLIIPSRSGATSKAASETVAELTARGVNVVAPKCDVSSETSLASVLDECARTMPPIKGCINAAMVLQDAIFQNSMTYAQWDLAMRSKVQTSWNLHRLLPRDLDFFILLSSLAGVVGQMASCNYAGGCSFQDALAQYRVAQGLKALSLDIGWMRNIGIIAETGAYQRQRQMADDMQPIDERELLAMLTLCCDPTMVSQAQGQVLFGLRTPVHMLVQGRTPSALLDRPLFAAFSYITGPGAASGGTDVERQTTQVDKEALAVRFRKATDSGERIQIVLRALAARLARVMSISPDDVEASKPLSAYGVDSLMSIELRNWIGREFGAIVAVFDIMAGVPIARIAALVVARSAVAKSSA